MSMLWQRFTERAKRVVIAAQEEAARAGEPYVSPEHLLIALFDQPDCMAVKVTQEMGVPASSVLAEVRKQEHASGKPALNTYDITLGPRMKRVLDMSYDEAKKTSTNYIGTEHLLLGLLREEHGDAFEALKELGIRLEPARRQVRAAAGEPPSEAPVDPPRNEPVEEPEQETLLVADPGPIVAGPRTLAGPPMMKGYRIRLFTQAAESESWINDMVQERMEIKHLHATSAGLWVIMRGPIPVPSAPQPEITPEEPETTQDGA